MQAFFVVFALCLASFWPSSAALGTDRFYNDISAPSPNGRFRVDAKSPDNAIPGQRRAFQSSFVYTCTDTKTNRVLWTRKQAMEAPSSTSSYQSWIEPSPKGILISDDGWTIIWDAMDEIIVVDLDGKDRGKVRLLEDAFTDYERDHCVKYSTAGPFWAKGSDWRFHEKGKNPALTITPSWGRKIVIDLESGAIEGSMASSWKRPIKDVQTLWPQRPIFRYYLMASAVLLVVVPIVLARWILKRQASRIYTGKTS